VTSRSEAHEAASRPSRLARNVELSIVVPAYNEAQRISPTLHEYGAHFKRLYGDAFELVVVLNGCSDNTRKVVEEIAASVPQVRVIEFVRPLGKGGAIWEGLAVANGNRLVFVDADNMVRAPETEKLVRALDSHDVAIADRFAGVQEGHPGQGPLRRLISAGSRRWVRNFLGLPFSDTQCGAKAFRNVAWRMIAPRVFERGWAFDLEVLAHSVRLDLKIAEVAVRWRHVAEGSKVRPWRDVPQTLWATVLIRRRMRRIAKRVW
jgi:dolichyl-phosphate beta-glucosyltransferase